MRPTQIHFRDTLFGGVFGVIGDALARRYDPAGSPANSAAFDPPPASGMPVAEGESGAARPRGIAGRLDRGFWRQRMNETESWLAQSQDVFELEERIRRLERSVGNRYYCRRLR